MVEDEDTGREMLTKLLEQYGAEVVAAASAAEALTALERGVPDVLISDIGMPGESGYDLLRRVRALPSSAAAGFRPSRSPPTPPARTAWTPSTPASRPTLPSRPIPPVWSR